MIRIQTTIILVSLGLVQFLSACGDLHSIDQIQEAKIGSAAQKTFVCGDENETVEGPGIVGGDRLRKRSLLANSVVFLRQLDTLNSESGGNTTCTGTLIAPDMIVTAAHCVSEGAEETRAARTKAYFGNDPHCSASQGNFDEVRESAAVLIHPEYAPTGEKIKFDLALIKLKSAAPKGYKPLSVAQTFIELEDEAPVFLAGFGVTTDFEVEDTGAPTLRFKKAKVFANSQSIKGVKNGADSPRLIFDQAGGGACRGDSGGPAIVKKDGKLKMIGVASQVSSHRGGTSTCKALVIHTSLSFYNEWLKTSFQSMNPGKKNPFETPPAKKLEKED